MDGDLGSEERRRPGNGVAVAPPVGQCLAIGAHADAELPVALGRDYPGVNLGGRAGQDTVRSRDVAGGDQGRVAGADGSNPSLAFGTRAGATAGFDSDGTDIPSPPPAPGMALSAHFRISAPFFPHLNADYRETLATTSGASVTWTLEVSSTTQPIALTWSVPASSGLPSDVSLTLAGSGATIDMRSSTTATYQAGTHTLTITARRGTSPTTPPTTTPTAPGDDEDDEAADDDSPGSTDDDSDDAPAPDDEPNDVVPDQQQPVQCTDLSVEPTQAVPGQEISVSATICNPNAVDSPATLTLTINGEPIESRTTSLRGSDCQEIVFKTSRALPGSFEVSINGMTGHFSVVEAGAVPTTIPAQPQRGIDTTGLIVLGAIVVVLVTAIIMVLRLR